MTLTETLPVTRSLLDPAALAELVATTYGFSIANCRLYRVSVVDTYDLWADNHRYWLRVYRTGHFSRRQIEAELALIDHLRGTGLTVPEPMTRKLGVGRLLKLSAAEGDRYAVLLRHVPGVPLRHHMDVAHSRAAGALLARAHRALDGSGQILDRPINDADRLLRDAMRGISGSGMLAHRGRDLAFLHHTTSVMRTRLVGLPRKAPGYGMTYGGLDPDSVLVLPEGGLALVDFGFSGEGWRAYDLAAFRALARLDRIPAQVGAAFLEGYEAERPLTAYERDVLPLLRATYHIWRIGLHGAHVNEWGSARLGEGAIDAMLDDVRSALMEVRLGA